MQEISPDQPQKRLRLGNRAPQGTVNLAYSAVPALTPQANVQIADTSGFIVENSQADQIQDLLLYSDESHLLSTAQGQDTIEAETFLLTNVFNVISDTVPLYYAHRLKWPIYDAPGPNPFGFYQGKAISLIDRNGEALDPGSYRILLQATGSANYYSVFIYTAFQTTPTDNTRAIYTAYITDDHLQPPVSRSIPGTMESLNPQPIFQKAGDLTQIISPTNQLAPLYYAMNARQFGTQKVYVPLATISDTRTPVRCRYRVFARDNTGQQVATTPWIMTEVFRDDSAVSEELNGSNRVFINGNFLVDLRTAAQILSDYTGLIQAVSYTYYAEPEDSTQATIFTLTNGLGYVMAKTAQDTGQVALPDLYRAEKEARSFTFDYEIHAIDPQGIATVVTTTSHYLLSTDEAPTNIHAVIPAEWGFPVTFDPNTWDIELVLTRTDSPLTLGFYDLNLQAFVTNAQGDSRLPYLSLASRSLMIRAIPSGNKKKFRPAYSLRCSGSKQIKPLMPREQSAIDNWYLRVQSGRFQRQAHDQEGLPIRYVYLLPEYYRQPFDSAYGTPYRKVTQEKPKVIGERKIKVHYTPLFVDYDPFAHQIRNLSVTVNQLPATVLAWDNADGSLELDTTVRDSDRITVDYHYEEYNVTYRGYFHTGLQKQIGLDLNPGRGHLYTEIALHPDTPDLTYAEVHERATFSLINETLYLFLRPAYEITDVQGVAEELLAIQNGQATLRHPALAQDPELKVYRLDTGELLPFLGATPAAKGWSWVIDTTQPDPIYQTLALTGIDPSATYAIDYRYQTGMEQLIPGSFQPNVLYHNFTGIKEQPQDELLGKVWVRPNSSKASIRMIDARTRGGGLLAQIGQSIMDDLDPEAKYYWDIGYWDGEPYQENAVVVVHLPNYILKENGGDFTKEQVNQAIEKHIAFGTFYLVDYIEEPKVLMEIPQHLTIDTIDTTQADAVTVTTPAFELTTVILAGG